MNEEIFADIVSDIFEGLNGDEILEKYTSKMKDTPKDALKEVREIDFAELGRKCREEYENK